MKSAVCTFPRIHSLIPLQQRCAVLLLWAALATMPIKLYAVLEPNCGGDHVDFPCVDCPCPVGQHDPHEADGSGCGSCLSSAGVGGMAVWRVSEPYMNLWIHDEPLGYQPSFGPRVSFMLSYKLRNDISGGDLLTFSVGYKWYFSWNSWMFPGNGSNVADIVHFPSGGARFFTNGVIDYYSGKRVNRVGNPITSYELESPDGSKIVYGFFVTNLVGVVRAFMTERQNQQGQATYFQYDSYDPNVGVVRLRYVVDSNNRTNTIYYAETHSLNTNLISQVVDAFGRTTTLQYNDDINSIQCALLTNITDVAGISSSFTYDGMSMTNMVTPYGATSFKTTGVGYTYAGRSVLITEPNGSKQLYAHINSAAGVPSSYGDVPDTSPFTNTFENSSMNLANSFHWNRLQYTVLNSTFRSTEDIADLSEADFKLARLRHWLAGNWDDIGHTLSIQREPSPDGTTEGQVTWFDYPGKPSNGHEGTQIMPRFIARVLPDESTWFVRTARNERWYVTNRVDTYTKPDQTVGVRTNTFDYAANNIDMFLHLGPSGEQVSSNLFNANHQVTTHYDALDQITTYLYNGNLQLTRIQWPSGLTTTNSYFTSGDYEDWLSQTVDVEINRTNSYTYDDGLIKSHTDERGLTVTNSWDDLQRLISVRYPDGTTVSNIYTALDLTATKDRLGYWTYFGYNGVRQKIAETNANGAVTRYGYCDCGALLSVTNAWNTSVELVTGFNYDFQGNRTYTYHPDATITNWYNALGQLEKTGDAWGYRWFYYNNQGLLTVVSNMYGNERITVHDIDDRALWVTDANGVTVTNTYDLLGRLRTRTYPDSGVEKFGYSARGLIAYTNQLNKETYYVYDEGMRKTWETNANSEVLRYTNNAAGDLLSLTDGKNQTTRWNYDEYGRATNKLDQVSAEILRYKYDPDSRLTNRWSTAKGDTYYGYDPVGNLTNINYPASTDVNFVYDALNRATTMVDAAGTTSYGYAAGGQLWTEDGPWSNDTVTNSYTYRMRTGLVLQQPTGVWTNEFWYDYAKRLTNVTSKAGTFSYELGGTAAQSLLSKKIVLPNTSYITNTYDSVARLTGTWLKNSSHSTLNSHQYTYNPGNQRTQQVFNVGSTYNYTYDNIGQLTFGDSATASEDRRYVYDAAWNLSFRTNNTTLYTYKVDTKNQLTNATGMTARTHDGNGNVTFGKTSSHSSEGFSYDDENRLQNWYWYDDDVDGGGSPTSSVDLRTEFIYDGFGRLRNRVEYTTDGMTWMVSSETRYHYDGGRVIQERDSSNVPAVSYSRGSDLSGTLERAGGIGGLLSRSHGYASSNGNWYVHNYYHTDDNGSITYLVNSSQTVAASYRYDPYGNTISSSGGLASANVCRFSSKEIHVNSGLYYYGYRWYHPNLQRWLNRDPIGERGGINLYGYVGNNPVSFVDPYGLWKLTIWYGRGYAGGLTLTGTGLNLEGFQVHLGGGSGWGFEYEPLAPDPNRPNDPSTLNPRPSGTMAVSAGASSFGGAKAGGFGGGWNCYAGGRFEPSSLTSEFLWHGDAGGDLGLFNVGSSVDAGVIQDASGNPPVSYGPEYDPTFSWGPSRNWNRKFGQFGFGSFLGGTFGSSW